VPSPTPTPTVSTPVGRLNGIRVIAGSVQSLSSANINGLISEITSLGYPAPNVVTSSLIGNTYTGADLDPAFDDIVIVAPGAWSQPTGSNVGATELANNIKTYLNNGGKVMWTTYFSSHPLGGPSGLFDFAMTPYSASGASTGNQVAGTPGNIIFESEGVGHPITNGVTANTNLSADLNAGFNFIRTNRNIRSGVNTIMSLGNPANTSNSNRTSLVSVMTYAGNRVSMYNCSTGALETFTSANTNPVARRIFANTVLWTAGMI
jgi:hypothetical protein